MSIQPWAFNAATGQWEYRTIESTAPSDQDPHPVYRPQEPAGYRQAVAGYQPNFVHPPVTSHIFDVFGCPPPGSVASDVRGTPSNTPTANDMEWIMPTSSVPARESLISFHLYAICSHLCKHVHSILLSMAKSTALHSLQVRKPRGTGYRSQALKDSDHPPLDSNIRFLPLHLQLP